MATPRSPRARLRPRSTCGTRGAPPHPLLDPALLRYPLFRAGIIGGSTFRIGIGAIPFLLPLMLQLGFGLTPFQSGLVTFVAAVGALSSKFMAQWVFRSFGFRNVLAAGALASAGFIAVNAFFTPATPPALIMGILLVGGIVRSVCFTGVNALVFSDVDERGREPGDGDQRGGAADSARHRRRAGRRRPRPGRGAARRRPGARRTPTPPSWSWSRCRRGRRSPSPSLGLPRDAGAAVSGHRRFTLPQSAAKQ